MTPAAHLSGKMALARPAAGGARRCPKCSRPCLPGESACARCGLLQHRFDRFAVGADPPAMSAAWEECLEDWSDGARHDKLLALAARLECLPGVARRYRRCLDDGPDAQASHRLQQIALMLETATRAQAREGRVGAAGRSVWLLGHAVAMMVMLASGWVLFLVLRHHG